MAPKTYLRSDEEKKLVFGFTFTFFDMHVDSRTVVGGGASLPSKRSVGFVPTRPQPGAFYRYAVAVLRRARQSKVSRLSEIGLYISKHLTK